LLIVIGALALIVLVIGIVIFIKARNDEINNYYSAAQSILKENKLDDLLKNPYNGNVSKDNYRIKPMLYMKFKDKSKCKYVFDLAENVYIGRDKEKNQVCVNEAIVSQQHCVISTDGVNAYVQDLNSANGLEVKRKLTTYTLGSGNSMILVSKDVLKIGTTKIKVVVFYFDMTLM